MNYIIIVCFFAILLQVVDSLAVTISNIISVDQQILDDLNQQGMLSVIAQAFEQVLNEVIVNNETGTYSQGTENIATMVRIYQKHRLQ